MSSYMTAARPKVASVSCGKGASDEGGQTLSALLSPPPAPGCDERLQLLVEAVVDYGIVALDPQGHVLTWNSGAENLKGYSRDEIIGKHFSAFYPPDAIAAGWPAQELRRAQQHGRFEGEGWRVRKDGSLFWANVVITPMRSTSGELLGFAEVTWNMTGRRRLEELERSSRRMNEFLAMLAHELRNPLAPVRNALTLMQLEPMASPAMRNSRDIIDRQIRHLTRLIDGLLDVGRFNTGKVKLRKEPARMEELVARSVETVRPLMEARRHQLSISLPDDPVWVHADTTRIAQILHNLLINAAKYTPDGGRIEIRTEQREGFVDTCVSDNGRGIDPAQLGSIFDLFAQGDTSAAPHESGLGIGLTLARSLAEMHGGAITAHSPGIGLGSTFVFRMPAGQAAPAQEQPTSNDEAPPRRHRIMVVDDNRDSADSTMTILRVLGHEVESAYDGPSALEMGRRLRPEVVLLDLFMPGTDGYETLRLLRAQPGMYKAFVIAMTGFGSDEDKQRTKEAGFDAHLVKPIELDILMRLLYQAGARPR